jgi:hypothetical protein
LGNQFLPKGQRSINHQPLRRQLNCARRWRISPWLLVVGWQRPNPAYREALPHRHSSR